MSAVQTAGLVLRSLRLGGSFLLRELGVSQLCFPRLPHTPLLGRHAVGRKHVAVPLFQVEEKYAIIQSNEYVASILFVETGLGSRTRLHGCL